MGGVLEEADRSLGDTDREKPPRATTDARRRTDRFQDEDEAEHAAHEGDRQRGVDHHDVSQGNRQALGDELALAPAGVRAGCRGGGAGRHHQDEEHVEHPGGTPGAWAGDVCPGASCVVVA